MAVRRRCQIPPQKAKTPDLYRRPEKLALMMPPLHERTFPRSLLRGRSWRREAIGMGLAHHCFNLNYHCCMILEIRQHYGYSASRWRGCKELNSDLTLRSRAP